MHSYESINRGRGKRKIDRQESGLIAKKGRMEKDLPQIEDRSMIILDNGEIVRQNSSELYKTLRQPLKSLLTA